MRSIDELEHLVESSKGMMGNRVVNEDRFYVLTTQLKLNLPEEIKRAEELARSSENIEYHSVSVSVIDELEHLVEISKGVLGSRVVDENQFWVLTTRLKSNLPEDLLNAERVISRETRSTPLELGCESKRTLGETKNALCLIDDLEQLVKSSTSMIGNRMINEEQVLNLVQRLRSALSEDLNVPKR